MLQLHQIQKQYRTGDLVQTALNKVSLNLRDNEFVAILGPSGSGKTTLLNIIGGLDRYDSGDLIINGVSTKKYTDRDWDAYRNHTIGFVFQSYNLIPHQTVLANVELALTISGVSRAERRRRAQAALEQVGLGEQAHKRPGQMSGGQMQRVAIARALVNNPDILLADEPTGALDSETSIQVMELLKEVARDRLVVMVTHNPELAERYATRIVTLKDGVIRSDTMPYEPEDEAAAAAPVHRNMGHSSMSLLTSLSLSFNNLLTKKARTLLTAFAGSIGIIGGADGPTAIYVTSRLAPEYLGPIAIAAYSYMALVPVIQPPIMRALTTKKERLIRMDSLRTVSKKEKIIFPIAVTAFVALLVPSATSLVGCLMLGNLFRECGVVDRLSDTAQNALMNIVVIFLGVSVGATAKAESFLAPTTLGILALGVVAFMGGTAGGVLLAKFMNLFLPEGKKINPLIGSAGVSAVPMAARVSQKEGQRADPGNFLLMHAMGPNVAGVIGSAVAAGVFIALFG